MANEELQNKQLQKLMQKCEKLESENQRLLDTMTKYILVYNSSVREILDIINENKFYIDDIDNAEVDNEKELIEYHKDFLMKINYRLLRIVAKISKDNNEL